MILKSLTLAPMHGFGISRRIEQISDGVFRVNPGSLLTAFRRLERAGCITAEWTETENNRRAKVYSLTRRGTAQFKRESSDRQRRTAAMLRLLEAD